MSLVSIGDMRALRKIGTVRVSGGVRVLSRWSHPKMSREEEIE